AASERGTIGQRLLRRDVLAELEDEAVRAVVRSRAEQAGYDDLRGHRAPHRGVVARWIREVQIVHDKAARLHLTEERRRELGGALGGVAQGGRERVVDMTGRLEPVEYLERQVLRDGRCRIA